ncbi:cytochrome C oxidase subunit IV family protein [Mycobacterium sp.]|uniref:cytochrome C oxidase subunit IV family protein n=1 Tax=Mycobacterium sp. TaxID=1785 RepID=UPI003C710EC3
MTTTAARTTTYAWIILSAITIVSWWLAPGHTRGAAVASVPITVAVVLLGFIKGRMIIRYFMEVRTAPLWLKLFTDAWLVILWAGVLAIYLY